MPSAQPPHPFRDWIRRVYFYTCPIICLRGVLTIVYPSCYLCRINRIIHALIHISLDDHMYVIEPQAVYIIIILGFFYRCFSACAPITVLYCLVSVYFLTTCCLHSVVFVHNNLALQIFSFLISW